MAFTVVAEPPARFEAWLASRAAPPPLPADEELRRGLDIFLSFGCGACHAIGGTEAAGIVGPDLSDVGGRLTLAAGTIPNNRRNLAKWIAASQAIKPESLMPSFAMLAPDELDAVAAYLESLK
jgi:cytochrome c oxidase subunit 2